MNIKKIEKQLKKLNQLFDAIKEDGTISPIERDLMLSYIRGLYEKVLIPQSASSDEKPIAKPSKVKEKAESVVAEETAPAPSSTSNPIANVVLQEVSEANQSNADKIPVSNTPVQDTIPPVQERATAFEAPAPPKMQTPQELMDLFTFESTNELSDKLSRAPITDLTKSMGINEKIFTVQELFGGDSALFSKAMETMDKFSSLDQARDYLIENVAIDQNWAADNKVKKAANFIKLVSRRY